MQMYEVISTTTSSIASRKMRAAPTLTPRTGRRLLILAAATTALLETACRFDRYERPAPGQPSMNELLHASAKENRQHQENENTLFTRAHNLTPNEAAGLLAKLKERPQNATAYWTLVRHYEHHANSNALSALRLWYIEHHPAGRIAPGNINPRLDRAGYARGKALWQAHLDRPGATALAYQRAADFLDGADRTLAEHVLTAGQRAYPKDDRWPTAFGRHYAQALLGSAEPITEFNVFRVVSAQEAATPYARSVRERLAQSDDALILAQTAYYVLAWCGHTMATRNEALALARAYVARALSLDPNNESIRAITVQLATVDEGMKAAALLTLPPAEQQTLQPSDQLLLALSVMRQRWMTKPEEAVASAREVLALVARYPGEPLAGDGLFEANILLGKHALRRGHRNMGARYLLAAARSPGSERLRRGEFEMNLPRALVDWGVRSSVATFYEQMAPKTVRAQQFRDWAAALRKGINPDLIPTFSYPGCSQGPC